MLLGEAVWEEEKDCEPVLLEEAVLVGDEDGTGVVEAGAQAGPGT